MGEVWKARDTRLERVVAIKRWTGTPGARFHSDLSREAFREAVGGHFDSNGAPCTRIVRAINGAHAARSNERHDAIGAETLSRLYLGDLRVFDESCRSGRRPPFGGVGSFVMIRQ